MTATIEPEKIRVTRYRCTHCGRSHSTRARALDHIGRCWSNPGVRACRTCVHHVVDTSEPDVGYVSPERCAASAEIDLSSGIRTNCPLWASVGGAA